MRKNTRVLEPRPPGPRRVFKVGDMVRFRFVSRDLQGRIIEDRGAIARGGQRLYRVLVETDDANREIELPAEELQMVARR